MSMVYHRLRRGVADLPGRKLPLEREKERDSMSSKLACFEDKILTLNFMCANLFRSSIKPCYVRHHKINDAQKKVFQTRIFLLSVIHWSSTVGKETHLCLALKIILSILSFFRTRSHQWQTDQMISLIPSRCPHPIKIPPQN